MLSLQSIETNAWFMMLCLCPPSTMKFDLTIKQKRKKDTLPFKLKVKQIDSVTTAFIWFFSRWRSCSYGRVRGTRKKDSGSSVPVSYISISNQIGTKKRFYFKFTKDKGLLYTNCKSNKPCTQSFLNGWEIHSRLRKNKQF